MIKIEMPEEPDEPNNPTEDFGTAEKTTVMPAEEENAATATTYACESCKFSAKTPSALATHKKKHSPPSYRCIACSEEFSKKTTCQDHIHSAHKCGANNSMYSCPCGLVFPEFRKFRTHCRYNHGKKTYRCNQCDKTFKRSDKLNRHMQTHEKRDFRCCKCGIDFRRQEVLVKHKRMKHGIMTIGELDHGVNAANRNSAEGGDSDEELMNGEDLATLLHIPASTHEVDVESGDKFSCVICRINFKRHGMFANHMRLNHPLSYVPKVPSVLKRRTLYRCPYCEQTFVNRTRRINHINRHHPDRPSSGVEKKQTMTVKHFVQTQLIQCPYCNSEYVNKWKRIEHIRAKHADKLTEGDNSALIPCVFCGKECADRLKLLDHVTSEHRAELKSGNRSHNQSFEEMFEKTLEASIRRYERGIDETLPYEPDDDDGLIRLSAMPTDNNFSRPLRPMTALPVESGVDNDDESTQFYFQAQPPDPMFLVPLVPLPSSSLSHPPPVVFSVNDLARPYRPVTALPVEQCVDISDNDNAHETVVDNSFNLCDDEFATSTGPMTPVTRASITDVNDQVLSTPDFASSSSANTTADCYIDSSSAIIHSYFSI